MRYLFYNQYSSPCVFDQIKHIVRLYFAAENTKRSRRRENFVIGKSRFHRDERASLFNERYAIFAKDGQRRHSPCRCKVKFFAVQRVFSRFLGAAVKRRVGFRIDPSREPGRWKRAGNRELKMVSEPRGRSARVLSPRRERPLQRPAVSSGGRKPLPQLRGRAREGTVNQGGTTEVLSRFRPCGLLPAEDGSVFLCFRLHEAQKNVLRGAKTIV